MRIVPALQQLPPTMTLRSAGAVPPTMLPAPRISTTLAVVPRNVVPVVSVPRKLPAIVLLLLAMPTPMLKLTPGEWLITRPRTAEPPLPTSTAAYSSTQLVPLLRGCGTVGIGGAALIAYRRQRTSERAQETASASLAVAAKAQTTAADALTFGPSNSFVTPPIVHCANGTLKLPNNWAPIPLQLDSPESTQWHH